MAHVVALMLLVGLSPAQWDDLKSPDPAVRVRAACTLKAEGRRAVQAIPALVELLADPTPVDRAVCGDRRSWWKSVPLDETSPGEQAAAALVAIGSASLAPLAEATRGPQWVARRNAVWALGALDDSRAVPPVIAALTDAEAPVRRQAAWALGALDDRQAVEALIAALGDVDAEVREQAAWALGAIGDRRATGALAGALKDASAKVRAQAAWALGAIGK